MTREEEMGRGQRKEIIIQNEISLKSCARFPALKKTRSYQANRMHLLHCWLRVKMNHAPFHSPSPGNWWQNCCWKRKSGGSNRPTTSSSRYHITWLPLGRKCHMQRYLYVLLYTAINPRQLLCIISHAQARCDLHPCHSSGQHFCTVFFLKTQHKYLITGFPDFCHGAFSLAEEGYRQHLVNHAHGWSFSATADEAMKLERTNSKSLNYKLRRPKE